MQIELGRDDFDWIVQGLRLVAERAGDGYDELTPLQWQRLETLRERVGDAFTGFLDLDGEG